MKKLPGDFIKEYLRIEKEEDRYDSHEIFTRIIELHIEPIRDKLSGNQEYFVLIGEIYQIIKEYVKSTYTKKVWQCLRNVI